ncbi:MAG: PSD1 and planctomycete cytochrome C domain-containing protein [Opitutaceae bacterium]|nr:PSD1 and planctomycete cytochrome C domain-containing protein [Opitutaceae bacterium]
METRPVFFRLIAALALFAAAAPMGAAVDASAAERDFTLKVLPLLKGKCFACHGEDPKKIKGGLNMLTREALLKGGEGLTDVLVPGQAEKSQMFVAITWKDPDLEMPPKENDRLTTAQIEIVRAWIDAGAPWPSEAEQKKHREMERTIAATADGVIVPTSGGLSEDWTYRRYQPEDIWGFQPVRQPAVPAVAKATHPVDAFVRAKLATAKVAPAPQTDPRTLIRRATFDLIGLPPTPEEVDAFVAASKQDATAAWSGLIDRLLASPHYAERWAQHWLDVTRYADTGGMANDFERSNMWRYRDYVIRSFNTDKPYNRFVLEQLAGDQLADAAARQRLGGDDAAVAKVRATGDYTPEEAEQIVATGYLRMGPWDNAMVKDDEARQIYRDDLVNNVGQTFLATTLRCFKCHDHKFDPLPTRDYYRIYAAFSATQMAERPLRFLPEEKQEGFAEGRAFVERMLAYAIGEKDKLVDKRETAARAWFKEHGLDYKTLEERKNLPDDQKPARAVGLDHVDEGQLKVREQDEWIWTRTRERYEPMAQSVYDGPDPKWSFKSARELRMPKSINAAWRPETHIFMGGSLEAPGEKVQPGVLSAIGLRVEGAETDPFVLPDDLTQRRLGLAKWIADARNPLTTRAIVNRVWQYHFGQPLAGTPNNFGVKGAKPTHPELLDWLTADFIAHGWTFKRLHKLIMMSETYRQSAQHSQSEKLRNDDPNNHLLAFFPHRRLTAEELRDAMLRTTGELNPTLGGLPAMPEINLEVALQPRMIQFSLAPAYQPSRTPEQRNRRSIYAYRLRGQADPFLEVFNQPNPNESCDARDSAAVSPQAFTMMNSDLVTDRAIAFARRVAKEAATLEQQVGRAFALALHRAPTDAEAQRMTAYVRQMQTYHRGVTPPPAKYPTRVTRSLVEEFSGKIFEYEEILPVFENYVPDPKPSDVTAETRALADLCLALFNTHEFAHLY